MKRVFIAGDRVKLIDQNLEGVVVKQIGDCVWVDVDDHMVMQFVASDVIHSGYVPYGQAVPRSNRFGIVNQIETKIDLHDFETLHEQVVQFEKVLHSSKWSQLHVIHGKGAGVLSARITEILKKWSKRYSFKLVDDANIIVFRN